MGITLEIVIEYLSPNGEWIIDRHHRSPKDGFGAYGSQKYGIFAKTLEFIKNNRQLPSNLSMDGLLKLFKWDCINSTWLSLEEVERCAMMTEKDMLKMLPEFDSMKNEIFWGKKYNVIIPYCKRTIKELGMIDARLLVAIVDS